MRDRHCTYSYDALNRNTTVDYSDTTTINPDITRFYDGATNGKGRFWYSYAGGTFTAGNTVEHTAIDNFDALGNPLIQRQLFKTNGSWSSTFQTQRTYSLAGAVTSQTYPSGRTVTYNYDNAGRMTSFTTAPLHSYRRDYYSPSDSRRQIVTARPSVVAGVPDGPSIVTAFRPNMYARFPSGENVTSVDVQVILNPGICILPLTYCRNASLPMTAGRPGASTTASSVQYERMRSRSLPSEATVAQSASRWRSRVLSAAKRNSST